MEPLTARQAEVLAYIRRYVQDHAGVAPTLDEIRQALRIRSLSTVHRHLEHLQAKGYIERRWNRTRGLTLEPPAAQAPALAEAFAAGWRAAAAAVVLPGLGEEQLAAALEQWMEGRS